MAVGHGLAVGRYLDDPGGLNLSVGDVLLHGAVGLVEDELALGRMFVGVAVDAAGAAGFLSKPFRAESLIDCLMTVLPGQKQ